MACLLFPACVSEWRLIAHPGVIKSLNGLAALCNDMVAVSCHSLVVNDSASSLFHAIVQLLMGPAATCPLYSVIQHGNDVHRLLELQMTRMTSHFKHFPNCFTLCMTKAVSRSLYVVKKSQSAADWLRNYTVPYICCGFWNDLVVSFMQSEPQPSTPSLRAST